MNLTHLGTFLKGKITWQKATKKKQITKLQGGIATFIQAKQLHQNMLTLLMSKLSGKICLNDEIL